MAEEKRIQNDILRAYATRPEMRLWRANVGKGVPLSFLAVVKKALWKGDFSEAIRLLESPPVISFGLKGQADLTGILPGGTRLEIEVKAKKGKLAKDQEVYQNMILNKGGLACVARSVGDVADAITNFLT